MSLKSDFETFCKEIQLDNLDDMKKTAGEIAKKLNKKYYEVEDDSSSHMMIVGSVGRMTAVKGNSDLDIIFELPHDVYTRFNAYESNGQSALLQEVKDEILKRYSRTKVRGDGQVVVIAFDKYTVELVPGFKNTDGSFTYPDTHNGGSWKKTDPVPEQEECKKSNEESNGVFFDFCHIIRMWKNTIGLAMGGLLIDTLVYDHFSENDFYREKGYQDYLFILYNLFDYFRNQKEDRDFWYAVGSNQKVYNADSGAFVKKAEKAHSQIEDAIKDINNLNAKLIDLLGVCFPVAVPAEQFTLSCHRNRFDTFRESSREQFIEELFPVDIRYQLSIDCLVTQDGFRPDYLSAILRKGKWLGRKKKLDFQIIKNTCPPPYDIYWKIRNVGSTAKERNMIRGEIIHTNNNHQKEHTDFFGPHYVECFLVKDDVCVARARIDVPIE